MRTKWMLVVAAGVVAVLLARALLQAPAKAELPVLGALPAFELIESADVPITRDDLLGQVWVADFIFTTCPSFCPRLTRQMATLQQHFEGTSGIALVSFSVDPETDDPQRLRDYAATHGADRARWRFVTGERGAVYSLIRDGFRLAVAERTEEEARDGEGPILHSDRFVLVDRQGRIRGYYHGTDDESVAQLGRDAVALAARDD